MKAIVYTQYGDPSVLQLKEVAKPTPKDNEVLIKIRATTVTPSCCMVRKGEPLWGRLILGLRTPSRKTPGIELSGDIEAVGKDVTRFKPGDKVYGFCGFGLGAYAQYVCMAEKGSLAIKPANKSYEDSAASVDGATTALYFLKSKGQIQSGQKVLINGASGSIGTFAIQLARYFGAEVTGVCSTKNVDLVASLGADHVIDYTREDFTRSGATYDIIFDTVGKSSFSDCQRALTKNGCYLPTVGLANNFHMLRTLLMGGKKVITGLSIDKNDALVFIKELLEAGKIIPVIDRCYPLENIAEAHEYVEKGHKKGNVVISVAHSV